MTYARMINEEDDATQELERPSPNEQLLRYIIGRDSSSADIDRDTLHRADASFIGTDFP